MKTILLILLTSVCASAQFKQKETAPDTLATFTPTAFQLQAIEEIEKQIEALRQKESELILFGFGVAVDPKTLKFDGVKFTAKKQ